MFRRNLPRWERILRVAAGAGLAAAGLTMASGLVGAGLAAAGAGMVASGVLAWCPACAIAGRSAPSGG